MQSGIKKGRVDKLKVNCNTKITNNTKETLHVTCLTINTQSDVYAQVFSHSNQVSESQLFNVDSERLLETMELQHGNFLYHRSLSHGSTRTTISLVATQ